MTIRRATIPDLPALTPLFDAYRQFYRKPSDLAGAERFLRERLEREESVVLLASGGDRSLGFAQLYPLFSSGLMARTFILNDLFVDPASRRGGVGTALLAAAADFARGVGAASLTLSTEETNSTAQRVYERAGWQRDTVFRVYRLPL